MWFLGQILRISADDKYDILFMDGYDKQGLGTKELRKVPSREKKKKSIGKTFHDDGNTTKE